MHFALFVGDPIGVPTAYMIKTCTSLVVNLLDSSLIWCHQVWHKTEAPRPLWTVFKVNCKEAFLRNTTPRIVLPLLSDSCKAWVYIPTSSSQPPLMFSAINSVFFLRCLSFLTYSFVCRENYLPSVTQIQWCCSSVFHFHPGWARYCILLVPLCW